MANEQLIKGAGYAAPINAGLADYYLRTKAKGFGGKLPRGYGYPSKSQLNRFLDTQQKEYIDNLPPGYSVEKLPTSMQGQVTQLFRQQRQQAGNFQRLKNRNPAGSAAWIDADSKFQGIKSQWTNMSSQLDNFQELKTEYLKDYDSRAISDAVNTDQLKMLFSTDDYVFGTENGNITFHLPDGSTVNGGDLPKYFNKNAKGAQKLIDLNHTAYKNGGEWDGPTRDLYQRQVKLIVREEGREGLLSLATDDFLDEPLVDKHGPNAWLLEPENHDQLEDFVINNWVDGIQSASASGYDKRQRKTTTSSSSGGTSRNTGASSEVALAAWDSGDLGSISNTSGWDTRYQVYDNGDGTFDIAFRERSNTAEVPIKKNIDPTNPDHKEWWLDGLGLSTSSIDTNLI
jgi:hypothetical protein